MSIRGWVATVILGTAALIPMPQGQPVGPPVAFPPYGSSYSVVTPQGATVVTPFIANGQVGWTATGPNAEEALPIPAQPLPQEPITIVPVF